MKNNEFVHKIDSSLWCSKGVQSVLGKQFKYVSERVHTLDVEATSNQIFMFYRCRISACLIPIESNWSH